MINSSCRRRKLLTHICPLDNKRSLSLSLAGDNEIWIRRVSNKAHGLECNEPEKSTANAARIYRATLNRIAHPSITGDIRRI